MFLTLHVFWRKTSLEDKYQNQDQDKEQYENQYWSETIDHQSKDSNIDYQDLLKRIEDRKKSYNLECHWIYF